MPNGFRLFRKALHQCLAIDSSTISFIIHFQFFLEYQIVTPKYLIEIVEYQSALYISFKGRQLARKIEPYESNFNYYCIPCFTC